MTDTLRHAGKTVLITGAASGIGLGILDRFLAEGANVAGFDLQPIPRSAERLLTLQGDAISEAAVDEAVARTVGHFGALDVMVCNAGIIAVTPVVEMSLAEWQRVMQVNVDSVFLGSRAAARQMIAQGKGGCIINASSGAGRRGVPNLSHYCASKSAIIMLTQSLAIELAPFGIRAKSKRRSGGALRRGLPAAPARHPRPWSRGFAAPCLWGASARRMTWHPPSLGWRPRMRPMSPVRPSR